MNRKISILVLLTAFLIACGGDGKPESPQVKPAATGPIDARIADDSLALTEAEWYYESSNRISSLSARAVDENGAGLPGVTASILIPTPVPMSPARAIRTVEADASGLFRLTDVPWNALLRVTAGPDLRRIVRAPELVIQGTDPAPIRLEPGGEVRGIVLLPDGTPYAGIPIIVTDRVPTSLARVVTDESGRFSVSGVAPGKALVYVLSDEYAGSVPELPIAAGQVTECRIQVLRPQPVVITVLDAESRRPLAGVTGSVLYTGERMFEADENGVLRVEGVCFPRIWLRGRGYAALPIELPLDRSEEVSIEVTMIRGLTVRGRVVDETGRPLPGVRVRVVAPAEAKALPTRGPLTGADGSFEVSWVNVPKTPVRMAVFAEAPGRHLERAHVVTVKAGDQVDDAEVTLAANLNANLRVVGADGRPVEGALVRIVGTRPVRAGEFDTFNSASCGLTGPDGAVELTGIVPQKVRVSIGVPGRLVWVDTREIPRVAAGSPPRVDLPEVRLESGLSIAGRVRSTAILLPENVTLQISIGAFSHTVLVESDGSFRCTGLPEGRIDLRVAAPGHEMLQVAADAGDEDLDLVITALSAYDLKFVWPDENVSGGRLEIKPLTGKIHKRNAIVRSLPGRPEAYVIRNLLAGTYLIKFQCADYFATETVPLGHGEIMGVVLTLRRGSVLRGTLKRPDGTAAPQTGITLELGDEKGTISRVTDEEGRFEFRGVMPGTHALRSHPEGYPPLRKPVELGEAVELEVDVQLRKGGRLKVIVRDASDRPAAGIRVSLAHADGSPARFWIPGGTRSQTATDGTVTLTGLAPGDYELSLFRNGSPQPWGKVSIEDGKTVEAKATLK